MSARYHFRLCFADDLSGEVRSHKTYADIDAAYTVGAAILRDLMRRPYTTNDRPRRVAVYRNNECVRSGILFPAAREVTK